MNAINVNVNIACKTAQAKIEKALEEVQGRCSVRTISFQDMIDALDKVEAQIGIPKCRLDGTKVSIDIHGDKFPSAYKYTPESTCFSARNDKGRWYITKISRERCATYNTRVVCRLSDGAKAAVLERVSAFAI